MIQMLCVKGLKHKVWNMYAHQTSAWVPTYITNSLTERQIDWPTNSMEKCPSEPNSCSATYETPIILWNLKFLYHLARVWYWSILRQMNPAHTHSSLFFKIRFNIILLVILSFSYSYQTLHPLLPHVNYMP